MTDNVTLIKTVTGYRCNINGVGYLVEFVLDTTQPRYLVRRQFAGNQELDSRFDHLFDVRAYLREIRDNG